jgi:YD repeat-containing protein
VTNVYNLFGQAVRVGDTAGSWTTNAYNNQGLLESVTNAFGQLQSQTFDIEDRLTNSVDANSVSLTMAYDNLGRLVARTFPDGGVEQFGYSAFGLVKYTNQLNFVTSYGYDAAQRKTSETNANSEVVSYTYSAASDLQTLTDGKTNTTTWHYDLFGRVTNKVDAASTEILRYQYDPGNRLTNRWSAAKGATTYRYDAEGNLTNVVYPVSPSITLAYDALNRLTNMVDGVGTNKFTYTSIGQLRTEGGLWASDTVTNGYNNVMLRSTLNLQQPSGVWTNAFAYDAAHRATNITSGAGGFTYQYSGPASVVQAILLPNNAYITNTYDNEARLTGTYLKNNSGVSLGDDYTYTYDPGNERTNVVRVTGNKIRYTYDNIGQLKTTFGSESNSTARLNEQFGYVDDKAWNLNNRKRQS